jgi:hypothetical protein
MHESLFDSLEDLSIGTNNKLNIKEKILNNNDKYVGNMSKPK